MTELTEHPYDVLAPAYDVLTAGHAHDAWLDGIERSATAHGLRGNGCSTWPAARARASPRCCGAATP